MLRPRRKLANGFTLLELLAAVVVMAIISVVLTPVMLAASDSYIVARQVRSDTERLAFALDRITRIVRQAPIGESESGVGVASASATQLVFTDGTGIQLTGDTLELLDTSGAAVPLCRGVEALTIAYTGADGLTSTLATPQNTHRFSFTLASGGARLSVVVHPRIWIGQEAS